MSNNLYQTIIYEITTIKNAHEKLKEFKEKLGVSGSIFLIVDNTYKDGIIETPFFEYIEVGVAIGLQYVNTIIFPIAQTSSIELKRNIKYLLWFVNDLSCMYFDKDTIREKHIWKDVEWGKRKKNYNDKGKDPSNIWIPTNDDGKGRITEHIILSLNAILNRCIISTTRHGDSVLIMTSFAVNIGELPKNRNINCTRGVLCCQDAFNPPLSNHAATNTFGGAKVYFKSSESMDSVKDSSVELIVTSPPYWDLKNYFKQGQIGQESYGEYLKRLSSVWQESYRVLKSQGSMWININVRSKDKTPILIPNDFIKNCLAIGFKLKEIVIWHKSSGIPTHKNNLVDKHEYFLCFVKDANFAFNTDVINEISEYKNIDLNGGIIWNINRKAGSVGKDFIHPAIYPTELIDRIVRLSTKENDTVMDPFLGSGTSMISALRNKRNFIGYEYNEGFHDLMLYRAAAEEKINSDNIQYYFDEKPLQSNKNIFRRPITTQ